MWHTLELVAWGVSAVLIIYMVVDWIRVDRSYSEDVLTSSREGELEAETEKAHHEG